MTWGSYTDRHRIGLDWERDRNPTQANPAVKVSAGVMQQTNYSSYDYDGTATWSGDLGSGSSTKRLSNSTALRHTTLAKTFDAYYSRTREITVTVKGKTASSSSTATHTETYTIPRRPTGTPTAPGAPSVSEMHTDAATLAWTPPSDMKGSSESWTYTLQVSPSSTFSSGVITRSTSLRSAMIGPFAPNTTYYARVRIAGTGWEGTTRTSSWSSTSSFKTELLPPGWVGGRTAPVVTATSVSQSWAVPPAGGGTVSLYGWEVRLLGDMVGPRVGTLVKSGTTTSTSVTVTGLQPGSRYQLHQRAYNGLWGPWQADVTGQDGTGFNTPPLPPTLTNYGISSLARTSAVVSGFVIGSTGGQPPSNVRVQRNSTATESGATTITKGSWANVALTGLAAETTYYYRASAYNSGGWGAWGPWKSFTTLSAVPNEPSGLTLTVAGDTSITVAWTAPALNGATLHGYNVVIATTNDAESPLQAFTTGPNETTAMFTGLKAGTTYYVFVKAVATPSDSGFSDGLAVETTGDPTSALAYVRINGEWMAGRFMFNNFGLWMTMVPYVRADGAWRQELP